MVLDVAELKKRILSLLKEDEEFRLVVVGLLRLDNVLLELKKLREETKRLREDFNKMFKMFNERMNRIERTLEKLTLDIEDEAREVIEERLSKMGFDIKLERLELPDFELNIYGVNKDICVIGEATVRLGLKEVKKLIRVFKKLVKEKPELLRPKKILVLYTSLATEIALKEAEKEGIWVLKAAKDLTKPPKL